MKRLLQFLTVGVFLLALNPIMAQRLTLSPEKPMPGEKIMITYNPAGSELEGLESFDAIAYVFSTSKTLPEAFEIPLAKSGDSYTGSVTTGADATAVLFSFANEEAEKADANDDKGYKVLCYKEDRKTAVPGAYATKGLIYGMYGRFGNVKRNTEKAVNLFKLEYKTYPESKNNFDYYRSYAMIAKQQNDEEALAGINADIDAAVSNRRAKEDELYHAYLLCNTLDDKEKGQGLKDKMLKKYPKGKAAKENMMAGFRGLKTTDEKIASLEKGTKLYGSDKDFENTVDYWASSIANNYAGDKDWTNFEKYAAMISSNSSKANTYNSAAWKMSGEGLDGESFDLEKARKYSGEALRLIREEMATAAGKPRSVTVSSWKKNMAFSYGMNADTYALVVYQLGEADEALKYQTIACEANKFSDGEMNERYCVYHEKAKGAKETEEILTDFIVNGDATPKMKEQHKRIFLANNSLESAYDKYMVQLEARAIAKMKEDLREEMLELPAPAFSLVNLKGEEVSLESLRGKVVVVDFWATWCGPCKASFPAMQKAVNKFSESEDVEFVFIDTWERGDDKEKNASDFITKNNYTFNVLMDNENEVVKSFGVSGIPTKFVVDKEGVIRFKSVGFGGNDDELVNQLTLMIEMAGGIVPASLTGTP
jgi:thiol-disulfide isomerase/thioredoxin